MESNEEFYDREIAPVLADLNSKCSARGMGFVAGVEYKSRSLGMTGSFSEGACHSLRWAWSAMMALDNVDALIGGLVAEATKRGHSSAYLTLLNVPMEPDRGGV